MKYLVPALSLLALLCFTAGTAVTALWLGGPLASIGSGLLAGALSCFLLAWQVER